MRTGARSGERRWPLAGLKRAELRVIARPPSDRIHVLSLEFASGRTVLSSQGYAGLGPPEDHTAAFAPFVRRLLADAADAAPQARFMRGPHPAAAGLVWTMLLIGAGAVVVLGASLAGGSPGLGLDLAARLAFLLLIAGCGWPWLGDPARRRLDPRDVPAGLLPFG